MRRWSLHVAAAVVGAAVLVGCNPAVGSVDVPVTTVMPTPTVSVAPTPALPTPTLSPGEYGDIAVIVRVVDGDTFKLDDGRTIRARGIDSPETKKPGTPVQCYGPEATDFAKRTLAGQNVAVIAAPKPDKYGRTLAWISLVDGRDYSTLAVEGGFARVYEASTTDELRAAESKAKAARVGLWGACPVELG